MSGSRLRVDWLGHKSATLGGGMATYSREITAGFRRKGLQVFMPDYSRVRANGAMLKPPKVQ